MNVSGKARQMFKVSHTGSTGVCTVCRQYRHSVTLDICCLLFRKAQVRSCFHCHIMRMHTKAQRLNKSPGKWQAQGLTPSFLLAYILGEYLQLDKQDQALCGPGISSIAFLYLRVNIRVLPNQAALTFSIAYDCVSAQ